MNHKFKVGDLVRLSKGWTCMHIVHIDEKKGIIFANYHPGNFEVINADYKRDITGWARWDPTSDGQCTHWGSFDSSQYYYQEGRWVCCHGKRELSGTDDPVQEFYDNSTSTGDKTMQGLYQTNEKKSRYGTFLITNAKGQYVLEMKGENGAVESFDKDDLIKVVPYTFAAVCIQSPTTKETFSCNEGDVSVGDLLIRDTNSLWSVTSINTQSENSSVKPFKGRKLVTTAFGEEDVNTDK